MRVTPEIARAMRDAGIDPDKLRGTPKEKAEKKVKALPAHCILDHHDGIMRRHEVKIEGWHPTKLNTLKAVHWAVEGRMKYADACVIGGELRRSGVLRGMTRRRVGLVIVLEKGQRGGDGDAYWKSLLDGLKRCGALVDDNRQHCELSVVQYERQSIMSTRIILEDL